MPTNLKDNFVSRIEAPGLDWGNGVAAALNAYTRGVFNVLEFDAPANGTDNDSPAFQAAIDALVTNGGGIIAVPPLGTNHYRLEDGLTFTGGHPFVFNALGAEIDYVGSERLFDMPNGATHDSRPIPLFLGGEYRGTIDALDCFRVQDGRALWLANTIRDFPNGAAYHIWNQNAWCERNTLIGNYVSNCQHAVNFSPADITGGSGTSSFARTVVQDMRVSGGNGPLFNFRGGVYGSRFHGINGNVSASPIIFHIEGAMGGTIIESADFEGSAFTYFEWSAAGGLAPTLRGPFILRSGATFETGTRPSFSGFGLGDEGHVYSGFPGTVYKLSLPTVNPGVVGQLWNNAGVVNVSAG